ncbi:hypothetical protein HAX54_013154, partial [Datura stramonium]|nr:hypothetical protein [Datura stramonium]
MGRGNKQWNVGLSAGFPHYSSQNSLNLLQRATNNDQFNQAMSAFIPSWIVGKFSTNGSWKLRSSSNDLIGTYKKSTE